MKRTTTVVSLLLLTNIAMAAGKVNDPTLRDIHPSARGRAYILHPSGILTDADRADLAARGIVVKHALTGGRYLARVTDEAVMSDSRIAAIEPLTAERKVHPSALAEASQGRVWAELNVVFHRDVPFDEARRVLLDHGAAMTQPLAVRYSPAQRVSVKLDPAQLLALAADERVLTIGGPRRFRFKTDNAVSASVSNVTPLHSAPYDLSGQGVTVSLFELGEAQATHAEFGGRLTLHASGGSADDRRHATHVSGTIGAAGVDANAKGMAPGVSIHQFCVTCGQENLEWLDFKDEDLQPLGVVADNNSWGFILGWGEGGAGFPVWNDFDRYYGAYDLFVAAPIDEISNSKGILFVHSAGNDGAGPSFQANFQHRHTDDEGDPINNRVFCYSLNGSGTDCPTSCTGGCEVTRHHDTLPFDSMGSAASAKNVLAVGNVVAGPGFSPQIASTSSRGPAKDGRVKPDVVARGSQVFSAVPTNTYGRLTGTSMAAPVVTGIAALLTEQWRRTFGGADPTPAQLRALILAGTDDLGNPGPDYTFGFGLVNAKKSVDLIRSDEGQGRRIRTLSVAQGQTHEVSVVVSEPGTLRVLLNWPDPFIQPLPDDDIAAVALVNDLDLTLIDPLGNTLRPYILNKNEPTAAATTGVNTVDNAEMIEVLNATPGVYRARVSGTRVPEGPQNAVLVSSARTATPCQDIRETNDTNETAYGNLVPRSDVSGAICTQSDVDFFKFNVTKTGPVTVTIRTGDTPIRATLTGNGISVTRDIPANSTETLNANASTVPNQVFLRIEATAAVGAVPTYSFTPVFGETIQPRRRTVRK